MKTIILCGGLGTRLKKIVNDRPKPMAQIGEFPFLEFLIKYLKKYNLKDFIFCISYMGEKVIKHFGNGKKFKINIQYAIEKNPLGTAGTIKNAQKLLKNEKSFLTLNGDTFLNINYNSLISYHQQKQGDGLIVLRKFKDISSKGEVKIDKKNQIISFEEKKPEHRPGLINGGIYLLTPKIFNFIPPNKSVSIENETFPQMLKKKSEIYGFKTNSYFIDIGTPIEYYRAQKELKLFLD